MDKSRELKQYAYLVKRQIKYLGLEYSDDLYQEGMIALYKAIKGSTCSSSNYYSRCIYWGLLGYRNKDSIIKIPLSKFPLKKLKELDNFIEAYLDSYGESPSIDYICKNINNFTKKEVVYYLNVSKFKNLKFTHKLDSTPVSEEDLDMEIDCVDLVDKLLENSKLTSKEKFILDKRYLKDDLYREDIGELMGVSRTRINQIEDRALSRLRRSVVNMGYYVRAEVLYK